MPVKVKYSRYLFTFNGNIKPSQFPGGEEALKQRYALCGEMLRKKHIEPLLYILKKGDTFGQHVLDVEVDYAIEKNSRGFWHCHAYCAIKHTTSLRAQYAVIKARMVKILGVKNGHFDAKLLGKDSGQSIADVRAYIHKGGQGLKGRATQEGVVVSQDGGQQQ